jgi:hypothetical protein
MDSNNSFREVLAAIVVSFLYGTVWAITRPSEKVSLRKCWLIRISVAALIITLLVLYFLHYN